MVCINRAANVTLLRRLDLKHRGELGDDLQPGIPRLL
jgi:hypothetical protein